jgi:hypothetical protein
MKPKIIKQMSKIAIGYLIIGMLIAVLSCSQGNDEELTKRSDKLKKQFLSLSRAGVSLDSLNPVMRDLRRVTFELSLKDPIWKGKPYADIIDKMVKNYDLSEMIEYQKSLPDIFNLWPHEKDDISDDRLKWNMEDAKKIKKIIVKSLRFEPEVDEHGFTWTARKYSIYVTQNGAGDLMIEITTNHN